MRAAVPVRSLAVSLVLAVAACGGSSGGSPGGAAGAAGAVGDAGAAGTDASPTGFGASGGAAGGASGMGAAGFFEGPPPDAGAGGGAGIDASGVDGASADAPTATDATFEAGAGGAADAAGEGGAVTSGPCAAIPINAPAAAVTNVDTGKAIDLAGFTGGALESGTYWLTSVAHFGAAYVGTTQEIFVIDATAKTVEDAYIPTAGGPVYRAFTYAGVTATTLTGTPICGTTATLSAYYTFAGSGRGATFSVSPFGTSDVKVYTKQ